MAFQLPRDLQPGPHANAAHVQENDRAIYDAIVQGAGTGWETYFSAVSQVSASAATIAIVNENRFTSSTGSNSLFNTGAPAWVPIAASTFAVSGGEYIPRFRLQAGLVLNGGDVTPNMPNFLVGLYAVTVVAGVVTPGALVPGSSITLNLTAAGLTAASAPGAEFALPADGNYIFAVTPGAAMPADLVMVLRVLLQVRYV